MGGRTRQGCSAAVAPPARAQVERNTARARLILHDCAPHGHFVEGRCAPRSDERKAWRLLPARTG